ncbi:MAG: histidine triad nucleotide-binding protein [Desulfobacterales bacterium]|nr:histidine triad nucleotide-binding protein [Desulfobacterales bacterium]MDX2512667.1 histidine triad nucleotide-binding protein [Desulfobacterales bacterium]
MTTDCIFCNIINGRTDTNFLFENEALVVFKDINPHAPVHLLVVPKKHIRSINDLTPADDGIVSSLISAGKHMADEVGIAVSGYKLVFNVERGGGQMIFHLHLHLLGGWRQGLRADKN